MATPKGPLPPRVSAPDLPDDLDAVGAIFRHDDLLQARVEGLSGAVDAAHARLAECVVAEASVDRLDFSGATLADVEIAEARATELIARDGHWRNVLVSGGRLGTLDLTSAELVGVELRGVRIGYLALGSARVADVLVADCTIGSLDIPLATLSRVRFEGSRADEVDTRGLRAEHLDLRGLEALSFTEPSSLRGATLSARQVDQHAGSFAAALGISVRD